MATQNVVIVPNLGSEFAVGTDEAGKITVKLDTSIVKAPDGTLGVNINALDIVSTDAGNLLSVGTDGGAVFNQAALQAAETAWTGSSTGFLTVTPAGNNGHAPTFAIDFTDAAFVEAAQDAIGAAIIDAADGIEYDDIANTIKTTLGNLAFGNGLTVDPVTNTVSILPDPNSPTTITVTAAGLSVDASAEATEVLCDAFGVPLAKAFPN